MLRAIFVTVLAGRLLVDMATPVMPGAFRFDPAESIDAHRTHPIRAAHEVVVRPAALPQMAADDVVRAGADRHPRTPSDEPPPRLGARLARHATEERPAAPDDH